MVAQTILSITLAASIVFETIATYSEGSHCALDLKECDYDSWCHCDDYHANKHCKVCNEYSGCSQCEDGYFKKNGGHGCVSCHDTIEGCDYCQDYNGCGDCKDDYDKYYDDDCGLWLCKKKDCRETIIETTSEDCDIDLVFAFDESGSIDNDEFDAEQMFGVAVVDALDADTQIAMVGFASSSRAIYEFSDSQDRDDIKNAINGIVQTGGTTNMIAAIDEAITSFNGGSPDRPNVLLLITDGVPNSSPCGEKADLDAAGITVVIVGIGSGFSQTAVECLVDNDDSRIIEASSFNDDDLLMIIDDVKEAVCQREVEVTVCPNGHKDSKGYIDYNNCPKKCENEPCDCCEQCFCELDTCSMDHGGCNQCQDGYFQKNKNYPCIQCQEMFGDACMHCADYHGCQQCKDTHERVYDHTCKLYKCQPKPPTPSSWWR